jgi:hypothetical protein
MMEDSIETIIQRATHGVFLLYNMQNETLSIITKGGFSETEIIDLMDKAIQLQTDQLIKKMNKVKEN